MKEKIKKLFAEKFNNKAIIKSIWETRMALFGITLGIVLVKIFTNGILGLIPIAIITPILLFLFAYIDFRLSDKLSKNKSSK